MDVVFENNEFNIINNCSGQKNFINTSGKNKGFHEDEEEKINKNEKKEILKSSIAVFNTSSKVDINELVSSHVMNFSIESGSVNNLKSGARALDQRIKNM